MKHIQPFAQGGPTALENLAFSCFGCNDFKKDYEFGIDPLTGDTIPLFNPRQQRWADHFVWGENVRIVVGRTPTGRATIQRLQLNRFGVVNLRDAMMLVGLHPPDDATIGTEAQSGT